MHTTGYSAGDAEMVRQYTDIVTACASSVVREICGPYAVLQAGSSVPVYALTPAGKHLILLRMAAIDYPLFTTHADLPVSGERCPKPLV